MGASPIQGAARLCPEFTCWNLSSPPKNGRCFSPCAKGCYSSQVCIVVSACTVAWFTGLLASMSLALGPVVRFGPEAYTRTLDKQFCGTPLSSYLQMLKVRLFSGGGTFVIQAIRFGLLVLSLKF